MFTTNSKELIHYILHLQPTLTWQQAEAKVRKMEAWIVRYRKSNAEKVFTVPTVLPKKNKSLKWRGISVEELKKREENLGHGTKEEHHTN